MVDGSTAWTKFTIIAFFSGLFCSNSCHVFGCPRYIHAGQTLNTSITTSGCSEGPEQHVGYLEHVVVKVLIVHPRRGDLEINLISPSGTRSQLLAKRWELYCTCQFQQHDAGLRYMKPTMFKFKIVICPRGAIGCAAVATTIKTSQIQNKSYIHNNTQ